MGVKIKEANLIDELTDSCLFPISDGSDKPRVANFVKVKEFLGDTKQAEKNINDLQRKINYLTRDGLDSRMSVREISEEVLSPIATNVETLIGTDRDKSVRTIATEVLAGASTGGGIDLDLYLSKSEAENTYEKKGIGYTKGEIDNKINEVVRINGEELSKKADKTTVESLSASVDVNKDILENIIVPQVAANTEAIKSKASQETVDAISESVGALSIRVDKKAESSAVQALVSQINNKVEKTTYDAKVAELEASIGGKYTKPAGGIPVKDLAAEVATETEVVNAISKAAEAIDAKLDNKVDKGIYNAKVSELVSGIEDKISKTDTIPAESIVPLSVGKSGIVANTPIIANRIPYLKADAFAFLQPEDFTVEVKYNDAVDWETLDNNNADMRGMFAQLNYGTGFSIDGSNTNWQVGSKIRITLSPKAARNAKIDFVALNVYANGRTFDILTEYYDSSSGKEGWYSVGDPINISSDGIAFVKYNQYFSFKGYARGGARFTFTITRNTQYGSRIVGLSGYGNLASEIIPTSSTAPYTLGTLWYWDYLKNVYFPNDIYEGGTPLKNKYASITGIPKELPNPKPLTIQINNLPKQTYKGDAATDLTIFAPTKIGKNNQVVKCRDGVMADWDYVKWNDIEDKPDVINFAKDLTGVLEATPEEFTYRPSAGDKSIRDESAVIRRIKGNTTVWEQRVHNANFSEGRNWWGYGNGTITIDPTDGSAKLTHNSDSSVSITQDSIRTIPAGHKTLFIVDYKRGVTQSDRSLLYYKRANVSWYDSVAIDNIASDERRVDALFLTTTDDTHLFLFYPCLNAPTGTVSTIYKAQLFDLTELFGAGNEPTTLEAFRAVYPDDYYPYCAPEIRNMRATAIETVGFNLYDGDYAKLIGGKTYYIGGTDIGTLTFTPNGTTASEVIELGDDRMYTPISSGKLSSIGTDICVHFQHSGIKDGECADYVEHMLELPEIAKYFPDGMNGTGKVYDEINAENAVTRFGVVDLGTLDWGIVGTANNVDKRIYSYGLSDVAKGVASGVVSNIMCDKYKAVSADQTYLRNKGISLSQTSTGVMLHIYDPNYNSDDKLTDFKASLNGVLLCYELAEPIVTPIIEPIQLAYDVEDFGTERAISPEDSAPFRADIVYQFNAEGRIRDNGRNIDKLELQVNTLDVVTKSIASHFDGKMVIADGLVDGEGNPFWLPSTRRIDKDKRLASEQYVIDSLPREVAQVLERKVGTIPQHLSPNILYESEGGVTSLTIVSFDGHDDNYEDVWRVRCGLYEGITINMPPAILWENGIAPNPTEWGIYEFEFRKTPSVDNNRILGRWRVYKS